MHFEHSFPVATTPEKAYAFLLDVPKVASCVPGAELTEDLGDGQYRGRIKVKVGAITASFNGTATIVERDEAARRATLRGQGRETAGSGSATLNASLVVDPSPEGARVSISTDLAITGRFAQFGRGIMEDVSARMVDQMARSIKERVEQGEGVESAPAAAPPLRATSLIAAVLLGYLRRLRSRLLRRNRRPELRAGAERDGR